MGSTVYSFACFLIGVPPTLTLTVEAVSDTQVNISVTLTDRSPCPDPITSYIVRATNAADNATVVSKDYSSIPQGEVLSGFNPSTSYRIVVAVQTESGATADSNERIVTTLTLQSGWCLIIPFSIIYLVLCSSDFV